ncbi:helix-turn-helix domain-containing protein [Candidatus Saccharibacteria bacterium]|nr:helix-turn-helix transcriptional regulator [Candidatus Saccharibacteria bacterium]NIV04147.1 helix-turn-helix domain-containing protein [Calditrichia bacterium]NIV72505.1 helix-turn-helix domain-containing protein [Calditrichia bacterium]NIV99612.1 helix-turn-helix domain-containing protein [Candidatus Saccharibacteria bacterium]NIW80895.1 helix-turn-helix domain-containing protein [Calditrichia bacterium]
MSKPKIILFSQELLNCPCYDTILNSDFETEATASETDFVTRIRRENADAAIVCLCSADKEEDELLYRLNPLSGAVPVLSCSRNLTPDFVQMATRQGVNRFLRFGMKREEIQDILFEAIRQGGLREWLEFCCLDRLNLSPHIHRLIEEIVHTFPHRIQASKMAQRLGISRNYLWKLSKQAFGMSFTRLLRRAWIHQALRLMQRTPLDNTEIAIHLNYSEESNMARDFVKELPYSPCKARQLLIRHSSEELLPP